MDSSITSEKVVGLLDWLFLTYGAPQHLCSDNGPELVARKVQEWLAEKNCQTIHITHRLPLGGGPRAGQGAVGLLGARSEIGYLKF